MEIRAKISLAIDSFRQNLKIVTGGYEQIAKTAKSSDNTIATSSKSTASAQIADIRRVELAAIASSKRIQSSYAGVVKLPLATVQQSSRSTVTATSSTQGLPARKTAEQNVLEAKSYRDMIDAKIKADSDFYAKKSQQVKTSAAEAIAAANRVLTTEERLSNALKSPDFERNMASIRYALYDIGGRAIAFSSAIVGAIAQSVKAFADLESSFTSVERVAAGLSGVALENLRQSLIDISTSAPLAFEEIAKIATLGGQMGISSDALAGFAQTVAEFSAVTGISADQAAQSFGRLAQMMDIPVSKFENLSSSILYAGVNSVATDREILAMAESIGSAANAAGISADQVIGLSTALASLKVRPEEARGVILRLFRTIDVEVSNGGAKLNDYANVLGLVSDAAGTAGEKAAQLWKQDPNKFFTSFLKGADSADNLNKVLQDLGITNTRDLNVVSKLAKNTDLLSSSLADARKEYILGEYASSSFSKANDNLASKIQMLNSAANEFSAKFGESLAGPLGAVLDILKGLTKAASAIPGPVKALAGVLGLLAAGALLLGGGLAVGIAGMLAMKLAIDRMSGSFPGLGINIATFKALFRELYEDFNIGAISANTFTSALTRIGIGAETAAAETGGLATAMNFLKASLGPIMLAFTALTIIWETVSAMKAAQEESAKLGDAFISAGGGAEALAKAVAQDTLSVGDSLGKIKVAYSEADAAAIKSDAKKYNSAKFINDISEATKKSVISHGKLADAADVDAQATANFAKAQKDAAGSVEATTVKMGALTAGFMIDALAKYKGKDGKQAGFFESLIDPKNANVKKAAESVGFTVGGFVQAGLKKSGGSTEYAQKLQANLSGAVDAFNKSGKPGLLSYAQSLKLTEQQTNSLYDAISKHSEDFVFDIGGAQTAIMNVFGALNNGAEGLDASTKSMEKNKAIVEQQKNALMDVGYSAEQADGMVGGLSEALGGYLDSSTAVQKANNALADTFTTFVQGINDTSDGLKGSREDFSNWSSFMQSAIDAAIASGEGFAGSVNRMIAAIIVLQRAGKDTKKPFTEMKTYIENAAKGEGYATLADKIHNATDPKQFRGLIQSWINSQDGATEAGKAAIKFGIALQGALTIDPALLQTYLDLFNGVSTAATTAKTALEKMQDATDKLFKSLKNVIGLSSSVRELGSSLADSKSWDKYAEAGQKNINNLLDSIDAIVTKSNGNGKKAVSDLLSLRAALIQTGQGSKTALSLISQEINKIGGSAKKTAKASTSEIAKMVKALTAGMNSAAGSSITTLSDYANKLKNVLSSVFEIRYGSTSALDAITSSWSNLKDAANDAAESLKAANAEIQGLSADRNTLVYQLSIAQKYGDTLSIDKIKAELAKLDSQIASKQSEIDKLTSTTNKTLTGDSKAAIANRATVMGLVTQYTNYLTSLANAGVSSDDLKKKAGELAADFLAQGKSLGFSADELQKYSDAFSGDFATVLSNLPTDVTVKVDTDPAIRAVREFVASTNSELSKINGIQINISPLTTKENVVQQQFATGGLVTGAGTGTSDSIPILASNGEFVMSARAVSTYGTDFMTSLNSMKVSMPSIGAQIASASGTASNGIVYLSPEDRNLLRAAIDRPINLYTENQRIAASANAGNVILAQRGSK